MTHDQWLSLGVGVIVVASFAIGVLLGQRRQR